MTVDRTGELSGIGELSELEFISDFVYLGSLLTDLGGCDRKIKRRTQIPTLIYNVHPAGKAEKSLTLPNRD